MPDARPDSFDLEAEQIDALRDLRRAHDAQAVSMSRLPHHAIHITMWTDQSDVPVCSGIITSAGSVYLDLIEAA